MAKPVKTVVYRIAIWLEREPKYPRTPWRGVCGCGTTFQTDTFERAQKWPDRHFRDDHRQVIERWRWDV